MKLVPSPIGPIGPFYHFALTPGWEGGDRSAGVMAGPDTKGARITLRIRVLDRDAAPVTNGMIELWQADAGGKYNHPADTQPGAADPSFHGFGRLATDDAGLCIFETVKPGRVESQAPHVNISIFAPGLLRPVMTRFYFDGDPANASDQVLNLVPADRRPTLLARPGAEAGTWHFDVYLQGPCETVFFDV